MRGPWCVILEGEKKITSLPEAVGPWGRCWLSCVINTSHAEPLRKRGRKEKTSYPVMEFIPSAAEYYTGTK